MIINKTMINLIRTKIDLRERSNPAEAAEMEARLDDLLLKLKAIKIDMMILLLDEKENYGKK